MKKSFEEFYNTHGEAYADKRETSQWALFHNLIEIPMVLSLLPDDLKGKNILDIGTGNWEYAKLFAERDAIVSTIDPSQTMLTIAQNNNQDYQNISYIHGDILTYNFDKKFDYIVGWFILWYIENLWIFFKKLSDLLNKNGTVVISGLHPTKTMGEIIWGKIHIDNARSYRNLDHSTDLWLNKELLTLYRHTPTSVAAAIKWSGLMIDDIKEKSENIQSTLPTVIVYKFIRK
jgi:2-polyprenyl-3-methyl-5-hydroxy-6-metoxy-1,4-benzoquinol methylase